MKDSFFLSLRKLKLNLLPHINMTTARQATTLRTSYLIKREKARPPAYTDRILYKGAMNVLEYARGELMMSDHRPGIWKLILIIVRGIFEVNIKTIGISFSSF